MKKLKGYLESHPKIYELIRYVIAGGLTTLLSLIISYGVSFILAEKAPQTEGLLPYITNSINNATSLQCAIANCVSWIISVFFAYWINRSMVFCAQDQGHWWLGLFEFAAGRLVSFFVFEEGLMLLLKWIGITNIANRIIVLVFVMVFNYIVSKFWIFKKEEKRD